MSITTQEICSLDEKGEMEESIIYYNLPYLLSSLFGTIMEDAVTELRILAECNNELRIIKAKCDWNYLLSLKYGIKQPETVDVLDNIDPHKLECDQYKINKLDSDRKFITDTLIGTYVDLSLNKTFKSLENIVNTRVARDDYRIFIVEDEAKNVLARKEITRQLRLHRNHMKRVLYDTDATIEDLKTNVEDFTLYAECRSRYTDNWQRARTEQHTQNLFDVERSYAETVEYYKQRTDHEHRVHSEIELLVNIIISDTLQKVEEWMNKYDKDMEAIDLKIQIKKNHYQNMLDKRLGLEKTIAQHAELMKNWVNFKEEREKARLYREKMTNAALCVQAWWRGLLVRRQLGPYKVSKKKGTQAKKK